MDNREGELKVKEAELGKHVSLTCPHCGHIYQCFIMWESTRLKYWCSVCGKPLYWEQEAENVET